MRWQMYEERGEKVRILTERAKATILLCSSLGLPEFVRNKLKPYTPNAWCSLGYKIINSEFKVPETLFNKSVEEIRSTLFISKEEATRIHSLLSYGANLALALEHYASQGIFVVTKSDEDYPKRLMKILNAKMVPPVLFYCGNLALANTFGIAMIGSRNIDYEGMRYAENLASQVAKHGYTIFSGGAKGVDQISVSSALNVGGKGVIFFAADMQKNVRQKEIRKWVENERLLVLSEVLPTTSFRAYNAMARNKYVYALSRAALVIAADKERGGTWSGAVESMKNGYVPVYVYDTDRYSGNKPLIKLGAAAIPQNIDWQSLFNSENTANREVTYKEISLFATPAKIEKPKDEIGVESINDKNKLCQKQVAAHHFGGIFNVIWPILQDILQQAKTEAEIYDSLADACLLKKQVRLWLDKAVEERLVIKSGRPIRYKIC